MRRSRDPLLLPEAVVSHHELRHFTLLVILSGDPRSTQELLSIGKSVFVVAGRKDSQVVVSHARSR